MQLFRELYTSFCDAALKMAGVEAGGSLFTRPSNKRMVAGTFVVRDPQYAQDLFHRGVVPNILLITGPG